MDGLKDIRQQGRDAKKHNDELGENGTAITVHDCPYGPGDLRDAWIAGLGGQEEEVKQVDGTKASTDDVRPKGDTETVREGAKPKGGKTAKAKQAKDATTVTTDVTGTGETSLVTKVAPSDPALSDKVPTPETVIGDPAASQGPNDANVQTVNDETGRSDNAPAGTKATGTDVKPESLM